MCTMRPVVEWRRYWLVTVRTAIPGGWPRTDSRELVADTPAQLRQIVEAARADVRVLGFRYESRRGLSDDEPTQCPVGHHYRHGDMVYPQLSRDFLNCACGGHVVITCNAPKDGAICGAQSIYPAFAYDCDVDSERYPNATFA